VSFSLLSHIVFAEDSIAIRHSAATADVRVWPFVSPNDINRRSRHNVFTCVHCRVQRRRTDQIRLVLQRHRGVFASKSAIGRPGFGLSPHAMKSSPASPDHQRTQGTWPASADVRRRDTWPNGGPT
jgi:hypothetical protein